MYIRTMCTNSCYFMCDLLSLSYSHEKVTSLESMLEVEQEKGTNGAYEGWMVCVCVLQCMFG